MTFWKRQTMETVEWLVVARGLGGKEGGMNSWSPEFLGQQNYSVWYYNGGYMSLYIRQSIWNVQHRECTLI